MFPGQYGIPRPFYFFLTPSYWCGTPVKKKQSLTGGEDNVQVNGEVLVSIGQVLNKCSFRLVISLTVCSTRVYVVSIRVLNLSYNTVVLYNAINKTFKKHLSWLNIMLL